MYQKIERYIKNLSKREKLVLMAAGVALGVFILLAGIVFPMMEYKDLSLIHISEPTRPY